MRIKMASFSNKSRKIMITYINNKVYEIHYDEIGIIKRLKRVWIDSETRGLSVGIEFEDGEKEYMPFDQPLYLRKDPEYMLKLQIEHITADLKEIIKKNHVSKSYLRNYSGISDLQIERLLDPTKVNKNLLQLYKVANLLGVEPQITFKKAV